MFAELKEKTGAFAGKQAFKSRLNTVGTAKTKANRTAVRKPVAFEERPSACSPASWKPCVSEGAYLLESCFWSCRTRAAVCCCCWVCCKPCLGNCHREKGESQRPSELRTESRQPRLVHSWPSPERAWSIPNPSPGGDGAFPGGAPRTESSGAQGVIYPCSLTHHQLMSWYHYITNHLQSQIESCLEGGLGPVPQAWPWVNGDKGMGAEAWTPSGLHLPAWWRREAR